MAKGEHSVHQCALDEYFRRYIDAYRARSVLSLSRFHPRTRSLGRSHARADNSLIYDKLGRAAHGPYPLPLPRAINHFRV